MSVIHVIDPAGRPHSLAAVEGWRVMEILRAHGLPVDGLCGGACACATCHVEVAPEWLGRLAEKRADEEDLLDTVPGAGPATRLSCQLIFGPELDGLALQLVDGAGI